MVEACWLPPAQRWPNLQHSPDAICTGQVPSLHQVQLSRSARLPSAQAQVPVFVLCTDDLAMHDVLPQSEMILLKCSCLSAVLLQSGLHLLPDSTCKLLRLYYAYNRLKLL